MQNSDYEELVLIKSASIKHLADRDQLAEVPGERVLHKLALAPPGSLAD